MYWQPNSQHFRNRTFNINIIFGFIKDKYRLRLQTILIKFGPFAISIKIVLSMFSCSRVPKIFAYFSLFTSLCCAFKYYVHESQNYLHTFLLLIFSWSAVPKIFSGCFLLSALFLSFVADFRIKEMSAFITSIFIFSVFDK